MSINYIDQVVYGMYISIETHCVYWHSPAWPCVLLSPLKCWAILLEKPTVLTGPYPTLRLCRQCWMVNLRNLILMPAALPMDCSCFREHSPMTAWSPPWTAAWGSALLQFFLCPSPWRISSFFSFSLVFAKLSHRFFPHIFLLHGVLLFLSIFLWRHHHLRSVGASWNLLCPAQGSSWPLPHRHHPANNIWTPTPKLHYIHIIHIIYI